MTFKTDVATDMAVFFNDEEHGETAKLNGVDCTVIVIDEVPAEEPGATYDLIDVVIQLADYPSIDYRTDVMVLRGSSWRYPKLRSGDEDAPTIRWRRNERPVIR